MKEQYTKPYDEAQRILRKYKLITPLDTKQILQYSNGIYTNGGENIIKREILQKQKREVTRYFIKETINIIQIQTAIQPEEINRGKYIFLKNKIYDIKRNKTLTFTPKIYSTKKINIEYDEKAECPKFNKFLKQVIEEKDIPIMQEIFGYCLYNQVIFQKAMIFLGEGSNGKSTLLDVLINLLGKENVSNIKVQDLAMNRFAKNELRNKFANIFHDLPATTIKETGELKALISGDPMFFDVKFDKGYTARNKAKILFSANKLPKTEDETDAYFRRWILINFPRVFTKENKDPDKIKEITTEKELSGIFNWSVIGLKRLLKNKCFTDEQTTEEIKEQYIRLSDSLQTFIDERIEMDYDGEGLNKDDFFISYKHYCENNNLKMDSKEKVGRRLPQLIKTQTSRPLNSEGSRIYCWSDIKFKDATEEK